jgi:TPR repeat protein
LGLFYAYGISVKQDIKEAIKRLQGVKEIPGARAALGSIYLGFTGEIDKARECFEYAASKEDGDGYCGLGMMYKEGIGVPQDYSKAYEFFNLAAAHGTAEAEYELGTMYYDGIGTQVDYDQAKYWFTEAANHGFAKGFNGLAQMYIDGKGADKDEEQSAVLFKKAADIGNTYAMLQLGYYYSSILKDPNKAFSWFSKAADNGEPAAMYELSQCYKNGLGTAADEKQAEVFLKKAMEAGYLPDVEPNGAPVVPFEVKLDNVVKDLTRNPKDYDEKLYLPVKNEELGVKLVFRCNINDVLFDKLLCRMFICCRQERVDELGSLIKKDPLAYGYPIQYPWGTSRELVHIERFISEEQFAVFVPYSTLLNSNGEFRETMMFAFISNNKDNVPLLLCCYNLPYQIKRSGTFSHKYSFDTL